MIRFELGDSSNVVLCLDNQLNELELIKNIKQLVINMQRASGQILLKKDNTPFSSDDFMAKKSEREKTITDKLTSGDKDSASSKVTLNNVVDGYWITLQGWSTCSLKCGGGTQSYHRMCVPPKNGGRPCRGDAILTKKCNEQPCPGIKGPNQEKDIESEAAKPIVKVMPFSSRYQKYTVSYIFILLYLYLEMHCKRK
jgi:hypothetical protein